PIVEDAGAEAAAGGVGAGAVLAVEAIRRTDHALVERGGEGDRLEGGAGDEGTAQRDVGGHAACAPCVGQDLAGRRVEDEDRAGRAPPLPHGVRELLLGDALEARVEGGGGAGRGGG